MLRSILIPLDLGAGSAPLLERAAGLPLAPDAQVTLLHAVPSLLPPPARAHAEIDARALLEQHGAKLAAALPSTVSVRRVVGGGSAPALIAEHAHELGAELIVMGSGRRGAIRAVVLGATAERVLRRSRVPVLVVRRSFERPYAAPLLALDLGQPFEPLLEATLGVLPTPRPALRWVHAYTAPFEGFVYPSFTAEEARDHRRHYRAQAFEGISTALQAAALTLAPEALTLRGHVLHGTPHTVVPDVILQRGIDLLVLGTHAYSPLARAFLGTVAGDLLREVPCDVLVVPPEEAPDERA